MAELLARGQNDGEIAPELDADACAWLVLSLLASQGFRATMMPDAKHLEARLRAIILGALTD